MSFEIDRRDDIGERSRGTEAVGLWIDELDDGVSDIHISGAWGVPSTGSSRFFEEFDDGCWVISDIGVSEYGFRMVTTR